jgi:enamine deaminase RidA (YjgF/YER057c/UK114 family)
MSAASIHEGVVRLAGQIAEDPSKDVTAQTEEVLATIDALLHEAGSSKHRILSAQIFLANMGDFDKMNVAWDAWVSQSDPPPRATVEARLASPACLVEIVVTAAQTA